MLRHNDAVSLLGSCRCPCHLRAAGLPCWCDPARARRAPAEPAETDPVAAAALARRRAELTARGYWWEPPAVGHNDAVAHLGSCLCPCHRGDRAACRCRGATDPVMAAAFAAKARRELQRRLATGRASAAEYARHAPHLLPRRGGRP